MKCVFPYPREFRTNLASLSRLFAPSAGRRFQFQKRNQLFSGAHNELLSRRDARLRSRRFVPRNPRLRYSPNSNRALLSLFAAQTLATTVKRFGAVSSVVERLVYTERVGGSNPSPPILHFSIFGLRLNSSRKHMNDGGFDMDLCCVEKWDAVVNRIAKN